MVVRRLREPPSPPHRGENGRRGLGGWGLKREANEDEKRILQDDVTHTHVHIQSERERARDEERDR